MVQKGYSWRIPAEPVKFPKTGLFRNGLPPVLGYWLLTVMPNGVLPAATVGAVSGASPPVLVIENW